MNEIRENRYKKGVFLTPSQRKSIKNKKKSIIENN